MSNFKKFSFNAQLNRTTLESIQLGTRLNTDCNRHPSKLITREKTARNEYAIELRKLILKIKSRIEVIFDLYLHIYGKLSINQKGKGLKMEKR